MTVVAARAHGGFLPARSGGGAFLTIFTRALLARLFLTRGIGAGAFGGGGFFARFLGDRLDGGLFRDRPIRNRLFRAGSRLAATRCAAGR